MHLSGFARFVYSACAIYPSAVSPSIMGYLFLFFAVSEQGKKREATLKLAYRCFMRTILILSRMLWRTINASLTLTEIVNV